MIDGKTPPRSIGVCDTAALQRNAALGVKHRINATPTLVFEDGTRVSGAWPAEKVEMQLIESADKPPNQAKR